MYSVQEKINPFTQKWIQHLDTMRPEHLQNIINDRPRRRKYIRRLRQRQSGVWNMMDLIPGVDDDATEREMQFSTSIKSL